MGLTYKPAGGGIIMGRTLRLQRRAAGLSQADLARELTARTAREIPQRMISRMESEHQFQVDGQVLAALLAVLG